MITKSQLGFAKNRACQTNLISFSPPLNRIIKLVEGNVVDIIYLDYNKVFDEVSHIGLF